MTPLRLSSRISFALVALAVALGAGCYNPKIKPGGLRCNTGFYMECPRGYHCDDTGFCQTGGPKDAGGDRAPSDVKVPEVGADKPPTDTGVDMTMTVDTGACLLPLANCTPDMSGGKKCDPVCNAGCGCHEKCASNTLGALTCNVPYMQGNHKEGRSCDAPNENSAMQTDNCEPGLACMNVACGYFCVRYCRVDADCPGSACTQTAAGGFKFCDVPFVDCDPVRAAGPCPGTSQGCYLSATVTDRTVCDCPAAPVGENASCMISRDCFPGLVCVDATGGRDFRCRRACSLVNTANSPCPAGNCKALNNSKKYGFCN